MVSNFVDLTLGGEGTDVTGIHLATRESETDVPGGEPDFLSWMVSGSGRSSCIDLARMSQNCPL